MKKLMFTAAAAAAGLAFGIESANTVGYTTQSWMSKGEYYMMGMQFETTTGGSVKLNNIDFGDMTGPLYDSGNQFRVTAPQVQLAFPDREGTTTYFYLADGNATFDGPGWTDNVGNPVDETKIVIPAGRGAWFKGNKALTLTFTK